MKKLTKQCTVDEKRREMLKQESKDSGIVTEMAMSVRPKEIPIMSKESDRKDTSASGSKSKRSFKTKDKSERIKRSQSVKEKRTKDKFVQQERSHDDLEVNICVLLHVILYVYHMCISRNLANHLYAKVYETQEDMCRKRNEIRIAKIQLGAIRAQV